MGLIQLPWGVTEMNNGVELGGKAILSNQFLNQFHRSSMIEFSYSDPDSLTTETYLDQLLKDYIDYNQKVNPKLDPKDLNILLGGDHSVSFGSYLWLSQNIPVQDLLIIHIDTHPDIMLIKESDTLNFHGKWQRPFFDTFDIAGFENLVPTKLLLDNLIMFGNFNDEKANMDFLIDKNISHFSKNDWQKGLEVLKTKQVGKKHIHISFDVDSLDQSIMPATGIPCSNGLLMPDLYSILDCLTTDHTFSIDIVEYNPTKDKDGSCKKLLQDFILEVVRKYS